MFGNTMLCDNLTHMLALSRYFFEITISGYQFSDKKNHRVVDSSVSPIFLGYKLAIIDTFISWFQYHGCAKVIFSSLNFQIVILL